MSAIPAGCAGAEARPGVIGSFAMTADGKISTASRTPSGFTSAEDKARFRRIRALGDAILAGRGTVETDTMTMTISDPDLRAERKSRGQSEYPLRIVVSGSGRLSPESRIFSARGGPIVLLTSPDASVRAHCRRGFPGPVHVREIPDQGGIASALAGLGAEFGLRTVVCEGGGALFRSLVEAGVVDELYLTIAPVVFGGHSAPAITGEPGEFFHSRIPFLLDSLEVIEGEAFCHFVKAA